MATDKFSRVYYDFTLEIHHADTLPAPFAYIAEGLEINFKISPDAFVYDRFVILDYVHTVTPQLDWLNFIPTEI